MKVPSLALGLVFAAVFIQTAAGKHCHSNCAACWKNGSPGIDIKMSCGGDGGNPCDDICPDGYNDLHCADSKRCS